MRERGKLRRARKRKKVEEREGTWGREPNSPAGRLKPSRCHCGPSTMMERAWVMEADVPCGSPSSTTH